MGGALVADANHSKKQYTKLHKFPSRRRNKPAGAGTKRTLKVKGGYNLAEAKFGGG